MPPPARTTLGTLAAAALTIFSGLLTLNGSSAVTLSTPAGGTVKFNAITGSGTGGLTIPAPSNVLFNNTVTIPGAVHLTGGTLTLNSSLVSIQGSGATTVNSGLLVLNGGTINPSPGTTTTVGLNGTIAGFGTITSPTVVSGSLNPSLSTAGLNFNDHWQPDHERRIDVHPPGQRRNGWRRCRTWRLSATTPATAP